MFQDTRGVIRSLKSKDLNTMAKQQSTKIQTIIYKTLHIKLNIEQNELKIWAELGYDNQFVTQIFCNG
jgi:hypothetical protein